MNTQNVTRPKKSLGADPAIHSDEELTLALQWIRSLDLTIQAAETSYKLEEQKIAEKRDKELALRIGKIKTSAKEYRQKIVEAVEAFVRQEADRLFAEGKTFTTPAGSIRSTAQPVKVQLPEGTKDKELIDQLLEAWDFQPEIDRLKSDFPDLFRLVRISFALDRQSILAAYNKKELTEEELAELGLSIGSDPEKVTLIL